MSVAFLVCEMSSAACRRKTFRILKKALCSNAFLSCKDARGSDGIYNPFRPNTSSAACRHKNVHQYFFIFAPSYSIFIKYEKNHTISICFDNQHDNKFCSSRLSDCNRYRWEHLPNRPYRHAMLDGGKYARHTQS